MGANRHRITAGRHLSAGQLVRLTQDFFVAPNPCDFGICPPPVCEDPDPDCCDQDTGDGKGIDDNPQDRRFYKAADAFAQTNGGEDLSSHFALGAINLMVPSHSQIFSENRNNLNDAADDKHSATQNIISNLGHARFREGMAVHDPLSALSYAAIKPIKGLTPAMSIGESSGRISSLQTRDNSGGIDFSADNQIIPAERKSSLVGAKDPRRAARGVDENSSLDDVNINTADLVTKVKSFSDINTTTNKEVTDTTRPEVGSRNAREFRRGGIDNDCPDNCNPGDSQNDCCCLSVCCGQCDDMQKCSLGETTPVCSCCSVGACCSSDGQSPPCCDDDPGGCDGGCDDSNGCKDSECPCCVDAGGSQSVCQAEKDCPIPAGDPRPGDICGGSNCFGGTEGCLTLDECLVCDGPGKQDCGDCDDVCPGTNCETKDDCGVCGGNGKQSCGECGDVKGCEFCPDDSSVCETDACTDPGCGCGSGKGPCDSNENECCSNNDPGADPIGNNGCIECDDCPDILFTRLNGSTVTSMKGNFANRDLVPFVYMKHDLNLGKGSGTVVGERDTIVSSQVVLTVSSVFGRLAFVGAKPHARKLKLDLYELKVNVDPQNSNCTQYANGQSWTSANGRNTTDRSATPVSSVTIDTSVIKGDKIHFDITEIARKAAKGDGNVKFMIEAGEYYTSPTNSTPAAGAKTKVAMLVEFEQEGMHRPKIVTNVMRGQSPSTARLAPGVARRRAIAGA